MTHQAPDWKMEPPHDTVADKMQAHWDEIKEQGYTTFTSIEEDRTIDLDDIDADFFQQPESAKMRELQRQMRHDEAGCLANKWCQARLEELMEEAKHDYYGI